MNQIIKYCKKLLESNKLLGFLLFIFLFVKLSIVFIPDFADSYYRSGIYSFLRGTYDLFFSWIGFPIIYIVFFGLIIGIYIKWKAIKDQQRVFLKMLKFIFKVVLALYFLFYLLWGFNYDAKSVSAILQLDKKVEQNDINEAYKSVSASISSILDSHNVEILPLTELQNHLRYQQKQVLKEFNIDTAANVKIKKLYPAGLLLRTSTSGIYMPYALEGYIDNGLHDLQIPFTLAHEMAHGFGITDEGECNFIAYITCRNSNIPYIRYSAVIGYWKYLIGYVKNWEGRDSVKLHPQFVADLGSIRTQMDKYPDIFPRLRNLIYDTFLKSNGVKQGMRSYSNFVRLVIQYDERKK